MSMLNETKDDWSYYQSVIQKGLTTALSPGRRRGKSLVKARAKQSEAIYTGQEPALE